MSFAVTEETVDLPITLFFKLELPAFCVLETDAIDIAVLVPETPFLIFLPLADWTTDPWALTTALDLWVWAVFF